MISCIKSRIFFGIVAIGLVVSLGNSCKKNNKDENEARSIEALKQANSGVRNQEACGKRVPNLDPLEDSKQALEGDAEIAKARNYEALPSLFKKTFTLQSFTLTDDVESDTECGAVFKKVISEERSKVSINSIGKDACWKPADGPGGYKVPKIVMRKNAAVVHHTMIAMATYAFIETLDQRLQGAPGLAEAMGKTPETKNALEVINDMKKNRKTLASDFLADVASQEAIQKVAAENSIATRFHKAFVIEDNKAVADNDHVQKFILAELTDTFYCSDKSRDSFTLTQFPKSFPVFRDAFRANFDK